MAFLKTSQEINKSYGGYRNKFYKNRKMIPRAAIDCTNGEIWFCQIAVKTHDEGLKCPYCGGKPDSNDWSDSIEYRGYDNELHICTQPYIVSQGSCSKCGKWWVVRTNPDDKGAVVMYEEPRSAHDYQPVNEGEAPLKV